MIAGSPEFDAVAEAYEEQLERGLALSGERKDYFAHGRVVWLAQCLARGGHPAPSRVLDFGCGTGSAAPFLHAELGAEHVVGLDVSERSISIARDVHRSSGTTFVTTREFEPCPEFDLVFCNGVFHHIAPKSRPASVDLIRRCLRPGGLFALWENNPWNPGARWVMHRIPFDRDAHMLSSVEARRLVEHAGLSALSTTFAFVFPRFLAWARSAESRLSALPLGAQYQVLSRKGTE